jgi:hypothetical protein
MLTFKQVKMTTAMDINIGEEHELLYLAARLSNG